MSRFANSTFNNELAGRLKAVRRELGLTQNELAATVGISARAYANYERAEREIPASVCEALYVRHQLDPLWLLTGPGPRPVYAFERAMDFRLLQSVIEVVDDVLQVREIRPSSSSRAKLIAGAYQACQRAGGVTSEGIQQIMTQMI